MKTDMPYEYALKEANAFIDMIRPLCVRVEIAGSLRRKKEIVGDIEIVCISRMIETPNLFGEMVPTPAIGGIESYFKFNKNGPNYKQVDMGEYNIDLFITTPAQWGVIFTIRTGSADFSKWLVTSRQKGGGCPSYLQVKDGRITDGKITYPTLEERDVFNLLHIPYLEPEKRVSGNWFYGGR